MWKGLLATLFAISLVACTTVTTDVDKQADFSSYKTFDFGEQSGTPTSLDARRIEQGLAAQLESKGLSRVKSGGGSVRAPRHH
ncbi:hypothetical protein ACOMICROBIO_LKFPLAJE_03776 [Vibrio sp. B1FIG11]|nr:hypothetical protein ACOMICROBIO_LKFPLAJE_03776 [Vibrio sp. B1FIG11]